MYTVVKKLKSLTPYEPISGNYRIRLDANESFVCLDNEKIIKELKYIPLNRYPDPYAQKTVSAFADFYGINKNIVTAGNGSDELISIITASFLEKGDKVLCFSPDFSMYKFYSHINELDIQIIEKDENFNIDFNYAAKYINENYIKCVMFSNPCNPTSVGFKADEIKKLITGTNALIILDEAYMEFFSETESFICETEKYDNLIVLKTCSKALALAGIRLGFAVSNPALTTALRAAKSPYNVNLISQEIGTLVLSDKSTVKAGVNLIKVSVQDLINTVKSRDYAFFERIYDTNTNFIFVKSKSSHNIFNYLLNNGIAVRCFDGFLRITCGTEYENEELIKALDSYK